MKKISSKKILLELALVLFLIVAGSIIFLSIKKSSVKNYENYQSDYGINLKYPSSWLKIEAPPTSGYGYQQTYFVSKNAQIKQAQNELNNYKNYKFDPLKLLDLKVYQSLDDFKKSQVAEDKRSQISNLQDFINYEIDNMNNDTNGYKLSDEGWFDINGTRIFTIGKTSPENHWPDELNCYAESNGKIYSLTFEGTRSWMRLSLEEKFILNSITFSEPIKSEIKPPSTDELTWQPYINNTSEYQLSLPNNWMVKPDDNGNSNFYSPETQAYEQISKWGYMGGESGISDFLIIKYDSFDQFKTKQEFTGKAESLESYIDTKLKEENSLIISSKKRMIGQYNGFQVEIGGMCGDTDLIFENKGNIYEIYSVCGDYISPVEEKIFSSLKVY